MATRSDQIRIISWNINRGERLHETIQFLSDQEADLILLQETDVNARRTDRRNIARDIAQAVKMNYVFGCEFEELTQGHSLSPAYHGQATLSRLPLSNARILRFQNQSSFWRPRWFIPQMRFLQRRLGGRMALISDVDLPERKLVLYNVHLESRGNNLLRCSQLSEIYDDLCQYSPDLPIVVAGDFNFDLCQKPAAAIVGNMRFDNPFDRRRSCHGADLSALNGSPAIDWILTTGPLIASEPKLHDSVRASDHYPLSLTLRFRPPA